MNRELRWITAVLLAYLPLQALADDPAIPGKIYDAKQAEEFSKGRFAEGLAGGAPFWTPTEAEVQALERALPEYLSSHWRADRGARIDASSHKRQYFGVSRNGSQLIFVNAFCKAYWEEGNPDWSTHFVFVFDGGSCFFQLLYDPSKQSFRDLQVNGLGKPTLPNRPFKLAGTSLSRDRASHRAGPPVGT